MNRRLFILLSLMCLMSLSWGAGYADAQTVPKAIVLNWVSISGKNVSNIQRLQQSLFDKVNEKAKGQLVIKYRGGPEVVNPFDQGKAVQSGMIDIAAPPVGFYEPLVPGIGAATLTRISLEEERQPGGAYDYMVGLHKKAGIFYLGRATFTEKPIFYLFLRKKVEVPKDFVRLRIGSATAAKAAVIGWGAAHVSVGMPEYFSAMERGVVDGIAGSPLANWVGEGCHEVTKYIVDHPFYQSSAAVIMNLNVWNNLPKHLQQIMMDSIIEAEKVQNAMYEDERTMMTKKCVDVGVKFYSFSPDVAKWFVNTAYEAQWDYQKKRFPEVTKELKRLLTK